MCLIFLSINNHPTYKLIIAGNRDEFYNRRTAVANYWPDYQDVVGGRDLEAGGTWLGMTRSGKIGMVTNYRDPQNINSNAPSRGHLVSDFLIHHDDAEEYLKNISVNGKKYNGFNLILGNVNELWYCSNYKTGIEKLSAGFYGISNHLLETPWPKVVRGKERIKPLLSNAIVDPEALFEILYDVQVAADSMLPNTGLALERERALSSMFIKTDGYGSRCSTVILVDQNDQVSFAERVYDFTTFKYSTQNFKFRAGKSQ
ncbi:MAG TPA: NRDE family protein [Chryseolinea sp.]